MQRTTVADFVPAPQIENKENLEGVPLVIEEFGKPFSTKYGMTIPVTCVKDDGSKCRVLIDPDGALNEPSVLGKRATLTSFPSQEHPGQRYYLWTAPPKKE